MLICNVGLEEICLRTPLQLPGAHSSPWYSPGKHNSGGRLAPWSCIRLVLSEPSLGTHINVFQVLTSTVHRTLKVVQDYETAVVDTGRIFHAAGVGVSSGMMPVANVE